MASFAFLYILSVVSRDLIITAFPDTLLSGGTVRSSELLDFIVGDAMPRQDLKRVCWCLLKLQKIELWPVLTPTLFFWKTEKLHLLSPSYSESSKLCLRL